MKKIFLNIIYIFTLFAVFAVTACDSFIYEYGDDNDNDPGAGFKTVGYMAIRLMPSDGNDSRAAVGDAYDAGTYGEMALCHEAKHYAIFYTEGQDLPIAVSELNGMTSDQSTDSQANSSLVYATIVARNELREMLERLNDCYVILNTDINYETLLTATKDDLLSKRVTTPYFIDSKGNRYFTMANSVYMESGKKKIFTYVDTEKIYSSYNECIEQAWKGNAAVNAYVERLAARFALSFEDEALNAPNASLIFQPEHNDMIVFTQVTSGDVPYYSDKDPVTGIPYSYRIELTGWGLNALEQQSFLFRNFKETGNYFNSWYNTTNKRAYWSEDCNYADNTYPWQYRRVIDNSGIPVYQNSKNILLNFSYDQINANRFGTGVQYSSENTYDFTDKEFSTKLNSIPQLLAGTHIIVTARILTNFKNASQWEANNIYRDRNGKFYRNELECVKAMVSSLNNTLRSHSFLKFTYWDWTKGGIELKLFGSTKGDFALYYGNRLLDLNYVEELYEQGISLLADAEFKGGDGKQILWSDKLSIRDSSGKVMQTYSNIDEVNSKNDVFLRESTDDDIKSVINEHFGAVDHYKNGAMYYAIPIGYVRNAADTDYDIYGVVRNSSYNIKITGVSGIGASVDKTDQPIIPNTITTNDHLYIGFDIIEWHPIDNTVSGAIS